MELCRSLVKTMAAVLLLLGIFLASAFVQPAFRAAVRGVRWLLRLDGAGSRRVKSFPEDVVAFMLARAFDRASHSASAA